tara:strand:+ start:79 stop:300 length:222 start_codon:yes stop_codon:yes gene_type:complete
MHYRITENKETYPIYELEVSETGEFEETELPIIKTVEIPREDYHRLTALFRAVEKANRLETFDKKRLEEKLKE